SERSSRTLRIVRHTSVTLVWRRDWSRPGLSLAGTAAASVVEADAPLTAREDGEDLAVLGLTAEHVADRLRAPLSRRHARPPRDPSEHLPLGLADLLEDDVAAVGRARVHAAIVRVQPESSSRAAATSAARTKIRHAPPGFVTVFPPKNGWVACK